MRRAVGAVALLVALFGALGGFAPTMGALVWIYSANRFTGAAAWGSMVKFVPEWFSARNMARAMGLLSLSFVLGGVCAGFLAGGIDKLMLETNLFGIDRWRAGALTPPATVTPFRLVGAAVRSSLAMARAERRRGHG